MTNKLKRNSWEERAKFLQLILGLKNELIKFSQEERASILMANMIEPMDKLLNFTRNMDKYSLQGNTLREKAMVELVKELDEVDNDVEKLNQEYMDYYTFLSMAYCRLDYELGLGLEKGVARLLLQKHLDILLETEKLFILVSGKNIKYIDMFNHLTDLQTILVSQIENLDIIYKSICGELNFKNKGE